MQVALRLPLLSPASQNQVSDLKEMNDALKKEVVELERKLAQIRGVSVFVFFHFLLTGLYLVADFEFTLILCLPK